MSTALQSAHSPSLPPSEHVAVDALRGLSIALSDVLSALPGRPSRASELADLLSIDRGLGWKVWRVAQASELPAAAHVPGPGAMERFLRASARTGVPSATVEIARGAFTTYSGAVKRHAGDRASAEIVLGQLSGEGLRRTEVRLRRDAFRASSFFLGVQARVLYRIDAVARSISSRDHADIGETSTATIRGHFGLWRTRADRAWVVNRSAVILPDLSVRSGYARGPMDPTLLEGDAPVLRDLCSAPPPRVFRELAGPGVVEDVLAAGPAGQGAADDVVTGEVITRPALHPKDPISASLMSVSTPCEYACFELALHPTVWDGSNVSLCLHTLVHGEIAACRPDKRERIPVTETIERIGSLDRVHGLPQVPRHAEMIERAVQSLGRPAGEFQLFRVRMRFPPTPVVVTLEYAPAF